MMIENNMTVMLSPSLKESGEGKRNKSSRGLSALLSASALGFFLEGCGLITGTDDVSTEPPPLVFRQVSGAAAYAASADGENFVGEEAESNTVSYESAYKGVGVNLKTPSENHGNFALRDIYDSIENILGSEYGDTLIGDEHSNILAGNAGNDRISGRGGGDIIRGGSGDDVLEGGEGDDFLEGGSGDDSYIFEANNGDDTIRFDSDGGRLMFRHLFFDARVVLGRNAGDDVTITYEGGSVTIKDGGGEDAYRAGGYRLYHGAQDVLVGNFYVGTSGRDVFTGTSEADFMLGFAGDDVFDGGGGDDILEGGAGDDILTGGTGDDTFDDGDGTNYLDGGLGDDSYILENNEALNIIRYDSDGGRLLFRDVDNDELIEYTLYEGNDVEVAIGEASIYIMSSSALRNGFYSLYIRADDDFSGFLYIGTTEGESLTADNRGSARMVGFSGDDILLGNLAADGLHGGPGNDELYGAGGKDILNGGGDNDLLWGGVGDDELQGGQGIDTYRFNAGDGKDIIRGEGDGVGNKLIFDPQAGGNYEDTNFAFNRGFLAGGETLNEHADGTDLEIIVSRGGEEKNHVIIQGYFLSGDDDAYTIYRNVISEDTVVSTAPLETA